jgi:ABC-2 type transport system permease protein
MQDYRTLKLLDKFEKLFRRFGIDYKIMRSILQVKLTMDGRRVPTIFSQNAKKKDKETSNQYIKSLWIYVLFGLFMIPFVLMGNNYLFQMSLFYGIFTFFIMTSMISDFSSVLLDIRDRNILFPKPIDKRTISMAKMVHILIYLSFLTIALAGIPLLVGLFKHGLLFFLTTVLSIILIDLFIVVLTALIYLFVLRFFDGEKLKDIINYVQIALSLGIMVGYQLLVRSFEFIDLSISLEHQWWQAFIFPMWYGAMMEVIMNGNAQLFHLLFTGLGILMPLLSIWIYIMLNPVFEQNLQKLSYHGKGKEKRHGKLGHFLLRIICQSDEERAFFRFAGSMMKNERDFKLKVYPSLGFSAVIPLIFIMNGFNTNLNQLSTSKSFLTVYFSLIIIPTILVLLKFSGKYKGAWIYRVAPIKQLKPMFSGTIKAFIFNLYLPVYLFISIIFIALFGVRILPDLIVVFLNACTFAVICFMVLKKFIPFSASFDEYNQNSNVAIFIGLMLFVALFAGIHYAATLISFGIYIYLVIAILCLGTLWRLAFNISWDQIGG